MKTITGWGYGAVRNSIGVEIFGTSQIGAYAQRLARGTLTSPTAVQLNDTVLSMEGYGYGATGYSADAMAYIRGKAAENWTDSAQGTNLIFTTTNKLSATPTDKIEITDDGNLSILTAGKGLIFSDVTAGKIPLSDGTRYIPAYPQSWYKGEAWYYTSTGGSPIQMYIDTTLLYHAIVLTTTAGAMQGFTHLAGQANAIASVAENSAGVSYKVTTTGNHNLTAGQPITHTGFTTRTTYRGKFIVQSCPSATEYIVLGTYLGTDTGFMKRAFTLRANTGTAGIFRVSYHITLRADTSSTEFKIELNTNIVDNDNIAGQKQMKFSSESNGIASMGMITIAAGDYIWLSIANLSDASDFRILHCNLSIG
jgi:hypothetical protein